jgi:hypothetical protein
MSVLQGLTDRNWTRSFSGGLNTTTAAEYLDLWNATALVQLHDRPDQTIWRWTPDGSYSSKSAYTMMHTGAIHFRGHSLIWKTWAPMKVKIFLWLAFKRRHWTNDRRVRHGLVAREECYLCDQAPETIDHLLTCCPYSREVWFFMCSALGRPLPPASTTVRSWWMRMRAGLQTSQRKGLDSLFALVSWQLWKERNARCFRESASPVAELLQVIKAQAELWVQAGAKHLGSIASGG